MSPLPVAGQAGAMSPQELVAQALQVRQPAYAPYSQYHVGAAVLGADGSVLPRLQCRKRRLSVDPLRRTRGPLDGGGPGLPGIHSHRRGHAGRGNALRRLSPGHGRVGAPDDCLHRRCSGPLPHHHRQGSPAGLVRCVQPDRNHAGPAESAHVCQRPYPAGDLSASPARVSAAHHARHELAPRAAGPVGADPARGSGHGRCPGRDDRAAAREPFGHRGAGRRPLPGARPLQYSPGYRRGLRSPCSTCKPSSPCSRPHWKGAQPTNRLRSILPTVCARWKMPWASRSVRS